MTPRLAASLLPGAGVVEPDRGTARSWAVEELARREYTQAQPNLLQRALLWLWDRLQQALDGASASGSAGALVIGLLAVVVVVVLALVLAGPLRAARAARPSAEVFGTLTRTAAEHRAAAAAAAGAGRWGEAVQERFRAVARSLEERAVLDRRPGRTASEVAVEVGDLLPGTGDPLRAAARAFDDVTYGELPGDEAAYRTCAEADDLVARTRPRHEPVPAGAAPARGPS
ncbi:DUF4129 domain-containing protein [Aquipuribacter sp. SD81]|uniref:DUF4129 domain-containing protein n=1 Tax=Aquipuribacter sp. SD81 TaxID=3127703 RepID=UPI00301770C7